MRPTAPVTRPPAPALHAAFDQHQRAVQQEVRHRQAETRQHRHADGEFVQQSRGDEGSDGRSPPPEAARQRSIDPERRHLREGEVPPAAPEVGQRTGRERGAWWYSETGSYRCASWRFSIKRGGLNIPPLKEVALDRFRCIADTRGEKSGSSFAPLAALHRLELNAHSHPAPPRTKQHQHQVDLEHHPPAPIRLDGAIGGSPFTHSP